MQARQLLLEEKSRDTVENARFSKTILQQHRFRQPLLVTSAFHMKRSLEAFHREGIAPIPVPANFITSKERPVIWADFLPDAGALQGSSTALREYLGLLYYRLGGERGSAADA